MCGRYTITAPIEALREIFGFTGPGLNLAPRYNAAPTQDLPVVRAGEGGGRRLDLLRWGLIPSWAKDEKIASKLINARAETAADKPSFRAAFRERRCLVAADGFYEWKAEKGRKQPYRVTLAGGAPFAFAGLWERWQPRGGTAIETFTILTVEAAPAIAAIHPRMPVILPRAAQADWLAAEASRAELEALLVPYAGALAAYKVGTTVNNVRNDGPDCLAPLAETGSLL